MEQMQSANFAMELRNEMLDEGLTSGESVSHAPSVEDDAPSIVNEYFSRAGDIGVYEERLQELDYNYEEGKVQRDFLQERGDPVAVPDEEFDDTYRDERIRIEDQLRDAKQDVRMLAQRCRTAGYDPEMYRNAPQSQHEESMNAAEDRPSTPQGPERNFQIQDWLMDVPEAPSSDPSSENLPD